VKVEARDLGVRLGGRTVFEGIDFSWQGPGTVAVTGRNGSGKTTLLRVLAGLLRPGRGQVTWHDGTKALGRVEARRRLGLLGPEVELYEELSALENLAFFAEARGLPWSDRHGEAWLDRLGLGGRGRERVGGFSSGMRQRVRIAFAFQAHAGLVLLDEPGTSLDDAGRSLLRELVREAEQTALVIVATNDALEAAWGATSIRLAA
jgi:heme exporter protein A